MISYAMGAQNALPSNGRSNGNRGCSVAEPSVGMSNEKAITCHPCPERRLKQPYRPNLLPKASQNAGNCNRWWPQNDRSRIF